MLHENSRLKRPNFSDETNSKSSKFRSNCQGLCSTQPSKADKQALCLILALFFSENKNQRLEHDLAHAYALDQILPLQLEAERDQRQQLEHTNSRLLDLLAEAGVYVIDI